MKKKVMALVMVMMLLVGLTGCANIKESVVIGKGTTQQVLDIMLDKPVTDMIVKQMAGQIDFESQGFEVVIKDGVEYYHMQKKVDETYEDLWKNQYQIATDYSLYAVQSSIDDYAKAQGIEYDGDLGKLIREFSVSVEFAYPVVQSNGTIDGNKVVFNLLDEANQKEIYAYCEGATNTLEEDQKTFIQRFNAEQHYPYKDKISDSYGSVSYTGTVSGDRTILYLTQAVFRLENGYTLVESKKNKVYKNGKALKSLKKVYDTKTKSFVFNKKGSWNVSLQISKKGKTYKFAFKEPIVLKENLQGNWQ